MVRMARMARTVMMVMMEIVVMMVIMMMYDDGNNVYSTQQNAAYNRHAYLSELCDLLFVCFAQFSV